MYKHHRTNHSRLLNREFLQKISLCFLIGFLCNMAFSNKSGRTGESEDICRLYRDKKRLFICLFFICQKCIWHHCLLCQSDSTSLFTGAVISFLVLCDNRKQAAKARKNHNCSYDFYFFNCLSD